MYSSVNFVVAQTVPADRLLVFDVRDGWEPLCRFLGVPVPQANFPHKNKSGTEVSSIITRSRMSDRIKREAVTFTMILFLMLTAAVLLLIIFLA